LEEDSVFVPILVFVSHYIDNPADKYKLTFQLVCKGICIAVTLNSEHTEMHKLIIVTEHF